MAESENEEVVDNHLTLEVEVTNEEIEKDPDRAALLTETLDYRNFFA